MRFTKKLLAAVLVLGTYPCFADDVAPTTYQMAKALADRDEKSLSSAQLRLLTAAQGNIGGKAVSECMASIRPKLTASFALAMELDTSGLIRKTWRDGETSIGKCFESKMQGKVLYAPPSSPFYTVFEIRFSQ